MGTIHIRIRYTQAGDGTPAQRALDITQEIPATTRGLWTDKILALPDLPPYDGTITIMLPREIAISPEAAREEIELGVVSLALDQELAERQAAKAKEREEWIAHLCEIENWATKASATGILDDRPWFISGSSRPSVHSDHTLSNRDTAVTLVGAERVAEIEAHLTTIRAHAAKLAAEERAKKDIEASERKAREKAAQVEQEVAKERRHAEIAEWAANHGSKRLRDLLALGRTGWPLYLHERLAADYPDAELDNDGVDHDRLTPSAEALVICKTVAARMVELGHADTCEQALKDVLDVKIIENQEAGSKAEYAVLADYRPGKDPSWAAKSIRWEVPETRTFLDDDCDSDSYDD